MTESDKMRRHWDRLARGDPMGVIATRRGWSRTELFESGAQVVSTFLAWAGPELRRGRALDLGCGIGRTAVALAGHFEHVDAIDISPMMIEQTQRSSSPPNVQFGVTGGHDLHQFDDARFDFVLCMLVLQHVPRGAVIRSNLAEIARVLHPEGRAVIQFDTRRRTVAARLYERLPDVVVGRTRVRFLRRYRRDESELRAMMAAAGLRIIAERGRRSENHVFLVGRGSGVLSGP